MKKRSKQRSSIALSIIIPAYKEERCIDNTLDQLSSYLRSAAFIREEDVEVIVVSADSPDRTHEIVRSKQGLFTHFTFIAPGPRVGKGRDVKTGMERATGKAVLFMDADLATPLKYIEPFYNAYIEGADVVIAIRDFRRYRANILRILVSTAGNILFRMAVGLWIEDSQCGFKLFSAKAAHVCFSRLRITGWGFDMEVLAATKANRLRLKRIRVPDWTAMPNGTFEDDVVMNAIHSLGDLSHIFYRRLFGKYRQIDTV